MTAPYDDAERAWEVLHAAGFPNYVHVVDPYFDEPDDERVVDVYVGPLPDLVLREFPIRTKDNGDGSFTLTQVSWLEPRDDERVVDVDDEDEERER